MLFQERVTKTKRSFENVFRLSKEFLSGSQSAEDFRQCRVFMP